MFRSPRHVAPALVVAATLTLTGCGGGLMTDGGKAASYDGTTVSTDQVQDAVADLTKAAPQGGVDGQTAAVFLALRPRLNQLAGQYGVGVSRDQAQEALKAIPDPSDAAIDTVQASIALGKLRDNPASQPAAERLVNDADVDLNPRYGTWVKGQGPGDPAAKNNWFARAAAPATPAAP